jgi:hypothetical protein
LRVMESDLLESGDSGDSGEFTVSAELQNEREHVH